MAAQLFPGPGGSLLSTLEVPPYTTDLLSGPYHAGTARAYGARWLIGESMTLAGMRGIAALLGLEFLEKAPEVEIHG